MKKEHSYACGQWKEQEIEAFFFFLSYFEYNNYIMGMAIKNTNMTFFRSVISKERNNKNQANKNKSGRKAGLSNCCSCSLFHSSTLKDSWIFSAVVVASTEGQQFIFLWIYSKHLNFHFNKNTWKNANAFIFPACLPCCRKSGTGNQEFNISACFPLLEVFRLPKEPTHGKNSVPLHKFIRRK